jgi:hypothetical protein
MAIPLRKYSRRLEKVVVRWSKGKPLSPDVELKGGSSGRHLLNIAVPCMSAPLATKKNQPFAENSEFNPHEKGNPTR